MSVQYRLVESAALIPKNLSRHSGVKSSWQLNSETLSNGIKEHIHLLGRRSFAVGFSLSFYRLIDPFVFVTKLNTRC